MQFTLIRNFLSKSNDGRLIRFLPIHHRVRDDIVSCIGLSAASIDADTTRPIRTRISRFFEPRLVLSNSMEKQQELIMNVGEEEGEGGQPSSWKCDQTEGPKPEPEIEEHRIEVEDWIGSVGKAKEGSTPSSQTPWPTIPKVPHLLRETKDFNKFFQPRLISIGPYHHGKPHLHPLEKIKPLCAKEFLAARQQRIEDVHKNIKSNIGTVRKCYDKNATIKYDDETLARMTLLDGCFILQFILCKGNIEVLREHEIPVVELDLFLLENQLPFGVLQLIFETADILSMKDKIKEFVISRITRLEEGTPVPKIQLEEPAHLLDLLRSVLLGREKKQEAYAHGCCRMRMKSSSNKESSSQVNWQSFRHISELKAAGIYFKPSGTWFLRDISFKSHFFYANLKLPLLFIDHSTKPRFLNLVAYEMCPDAPHDYAVTSFLCFLDSLIDHADDVKELRNKKILYNCLGSDKEVARIFNQIADGLVDLDVYKDVKDDIQKRYNKKVNTWIAQALHNHFSSPWTIMASIAAFFMLLFTGVQTYYAIPGNSRDKLCSIIQQIKSWLSTYCKPQNQTWGDFFRSLPPWQAPPSLLETIKPLCPQEFLNDSKQDKGRSATTEDRQV